jgi:transposase
METVTLNKEQQRRARVLASLSAGAMSKSDAEVFLGLSRRQVNRAVKAYREEGLSSVIHGNAGRPPANKTDGDVLSKIGQLTGDGGRYKGFNTCHLHDMLTDFEDIRIGRSTLGRVLLPEVSKKGDGPVKRKRRVRSTCEGMMLQVDGSPHDWLEGRGPRMTLMGAIDDATSNIRYLHFRPTEDAAGYLMMLRKITQDFGIPVSIYHDRHTILVSPKEATIEDELAGLRPMSQLGRVMEELGIESIAAHSPQAKGRIERLWGVLQDRLVKEMRAAGISTIEQANAFLPEFIERFNRRFGVEPVDPSPAWVEAGDIDLDYYFSMRESRVVRNDHTISWLGSALQIKRIPTDPSLSGRKVNVHITPEGAVVIYSGKVRLDHEQIDAPPGPFAQQKKALDKSAIETQAPDPVARKRQLGWLFGNTPAGVG